MGGEDTASDGDQARMSHRFATRTTRAGSCVGIGSCSPADAKSASAEAPQRGQDARVAGVAANAAATKSRNAVARAGTWDADG